MNNSKFMDLLEEWMVNSSDFEYDYDYDHIAPPGEYAAGKWPALFARVARRRRQKKENQHTRNCGCNR